jgi:hypothetical protein
LLKPDCAIINRDMSTLAEIESATDALLPEQKEELLLFLAERLRVERSDAPQSRKFSKTELQGWMAEDEADMVRFRESA